MTISSGGSNGATAAREAMDQATEQAERVARTAVDYGRRGAQTAYRTARGAAETARGYARERPVQLALLALGGLLLASILLRRR